MPFQSEKQRRYLHANHPEIAKRWERDYANGGILDINASEEIISDDGNEIELTDYNAAFDDPNDLSTGVKSLFRAKDGGRIGFFTGMREQEQRQQERSTRGPRDDPDRGGQPSTPSRPTMRDVAGPVQPTKTVPPTRDDRQTYSPHTDTPTQIAEQKQLDILQDIERREEEKIDPIKTPEEKDHWLKTLGKIAAFVATGGASLGIKVPSVVQLAATGYNSYNKLNNIIEYGKKYNLISKDISLDKIISQTTGNIRKNFEELKKKKALYDSLPDGHPEKIALSIELEIGKKPEHLGDGDGDEGPIVDPVTLEVDQEYAQGEDGYPGFSLADMRAKQALNAQLQQKWAAEQEAYDQLYLGANSGGLANLFRVKNKY